MFLHLPRRRAPAVVPRGIQSRANRSAARAGPGPEGRGLALLLFSLSQRTARQEYSCVFARAKRRAPTPAWVRAFPFSSQPPMTPIPEGHNII